MKQNLCPCRKLNLEKKSTGGASENVSLNVKNHLKVHLGTIRKR